MQRFIPSESNQSPSSKEKIMNILPKAAVNLLESYHQEFDLSEIQALVSDAELHDHIRYTAYLYLVAHAPLATLQALAAHMNFQYCDSLNQSAAFVAIAAGRKDILNWLVREKNVSLHTKKIDGQGLVLFAIAKNQTEIFMQLVQPLAAGGYGLDIEETDSNGNNALLTAAAKGNCHLFRLLQREKSKGGFGLSIKAKNKNGNNVVLAAIGGGQIVMLRQLLQAKSKGGYGCSINTKNSYGSGAVLYAIANGRLETLRIITAAEKDGGCGLSLDVKNNNNLGPVQIAIMNGNKDMLVTLTKPENENGYGLKIEDIKQLLKLAKDNLKEEVFIWLFIQEFDKQLKQEGCLFAITWAKIAKLQFEFCINTLNSMLMERYKKTLDFLFTAKLSDGGLKIIENIINAMEAIVTGTGRLHFAHLHLADENYSTAFELYLSIFKDFECSQEQREFAGIELANIIFNGYHGSDEEYKHAQIDLTILQRRVIIAYEYLYANKSSIATAMRERFDMILSGHTNLIHHAEAEWTKDAYVQYCKYYGAKNPNLLLDTKCEKMYAKYDKPADADADPANDAVNLSTFHMSLFAVAVSPRTNGGQKNLQNQCSNSM